MGKKSRKWANLKGQLPEKAQDHLSPEFKLVLEEKDKRTGKTMKELAEEYQSLEEEEAFAELEAAARRRVFDALDLLVLEKLEEVKRVAGADIWRGGDTLGTFSEKLQPRPLIKDKHTLLQWIRDTQQEHLLTLPKPRLTSIVCEALDVEEAVNMTPAERAAMQPGQPASGQPPPGVEVFLQRTVHRTSARRKVARPSDDDE